MDNDHSNRTYDEEQPQKGVPFLLKLLFPGPADDLLQLDAVQSRAEELQKELDTVLSRLSAAREASHAKAMDIVNAASQAQELAAKQKEEDILTQLRMIDPDINSLEDVCLKLAACKEAKEEPTDTFAIDIDDAETAPAAEEETPAEEEAPMEIDACENEPAAAAEQVDVDALIARHEAEIDNIQNFHKEELQGIIADYEKQIEALHLQTEAYLDKTMAEKDAYAQSLRAEIDELKESADKHSEEIEAKNEAISQYYTYFAQLFDAFMDRVTAIRDAYTGTDPDCPVARAISGKIMANDSYGLDDFLVDLRASMEASSLEPAELRTKAREAFLECLQTSSANWLNVLARLYAYGQVPFARKTLADAGLDMPLIDRAFISLEDILAYAGIDLYMPKLFIDNFNPEYHTNQPIRNIDTYVADIAAHAGPDTIVDLYLVGYDDGASQRKPVVSKFA